MHHRATTGLVKLNSTSECWRSQGHHEHRPSARPQAITHTYRSALTTVPPERASRNVIALPSVDHPVGTLSPCMAHRKALVPERILCHTFKHVTENKDIDNRYHSGREPGCEEQYVDLRDWRLFRACTGESVQSSRCQQLRGGRWRSFCFHAKCSFGAIGNHIYN